MVGYVLALDANAAQGIAPRLGCGSINHFEVRSLWLQEAVSRGLVRVIRFPSVRNLADFGAKVFAADRLQLVRQHCGFHIENESGRATRVATVKALPHGHNRVEAADERSCVRVRSS